MLVGWRAWPVQSADAPLALWAGIAAALAMGVQNAASRLVLTGLAPTTVMTGNVTQLILDAVDLARGGADGTLRQRAVKFIGPIIAFAFGAIGGALGYVRFAFWSLLAPVAALAILAVICGADGNRHAATAS
jgi:uncharacterized membrane protein YoaK (UPF0700 family)